MYARARGAVCEAFVMGSEDAAGLALIEKEVGFYGGDLMGLGVAHTLVACT